MEQTTATRINAAGNIVGGYIDSTGFHGFLLSGGDLTSFDFPGVLFTIANGINDAGGIVGTYQDGTSLLHGFLLETGPTPLERLDCKREPSLRSIEGSTPTSITFVNNTAGTVTVYWLDYSGSRVPYYALPAGDSYVQGTFLTHPWVVTDSSGQCLGIYLPVSRPGVAVIR